MFFKINDDLFQISHIEAICIQDGDDHCVEVSTISGSTFEYHYDSNKSALRVINQLEKVFSIASKYPIIRVENPDIDTLYTNDNHELINRESQTGIDFFVQSIKNSDNGTKINQSETDNQELFQTKSVWELLGDNSTDKEHK